MRRTTVLIWVVLAWPILARADAIDLVNQGGTVSFTGVGIVSQGSPLVGFNGIAAPRGHALGSVRFSTGALVSGSIWTGATFSSAGSSFVIYDVGNGGQPKGVIFSGAFGGPITWTVVSHDQQLWTFTLSGRIRGQVWDGRVINGSTTQSLYAYQGQELKLQDGHSALGRFVLVTPEPGTLVLVGIGFLGVAGAGRCKLLD